MEITFNTEKRVYVLRWITAIIYTLLIFAFLPVFPYVWSFLSHSYPALLKWLTLSFIPAVVFSFFSYCIFVGRKKDPLFYFGAAIILLAFGLLVYFSCDFMAERLHLAEYGLLVVFVYRALSLRMKTVRVYTVVMLYAFAVGLLDEIIQGILPNRVYETRDVFINWTSVFLGTCLVAGFTWRQFVSGVSIRNFKRWAFAVLLFMLFGQTGFFYYTYIRPPLNVILLSVDTLRPDHLGCSGYTRDTTPFLDSIARKCVIFENVISSAPWTCPGMISLFTGLYPSVHGVEARGQSLLPGTVTIFDIFKEHGYLVPNIAYLTNIPNFANLGLESKDEQYLSTASLPGNELLNWIKEHRRDRFLVWYHYRFLHLPYVPKEEYNVFMNDKIKTVLDSPSIKMVQEEAVIPIGTISFSPEEQEAVIALYDGQLRELDHFINRLYENMTRWKLHRKTMLVITADHGEELFEHGFIGHASTAIHATMFDEVLKIPLILYAPSRLKEGKVIKKQVRQIDIMPTILDIVGLPISDSLHGISLLPLIKDGDKKEIPPAISESNMGGYQSTPEQEKIILRSIRTGDWKLICINDGDNQEYQLFNLRQDPCEKRNLVTIEETVASKIKKQLDSTLAEMQTQRLAMLAKEKVAFTEADIPDGTTLEKPGILSPQDGEVIRMKKQGQIHMQWTGDRRLTYVIEYDLGKGWRNLKGKIPVHGTMKVFGPLPYEAWEPLPYWNPYRIRISPYGLEKYWSDWTTFLIEHEKES